MKRGRKHIIKIELDKPKPVIETVKITKKPIIINFD